MNTFALNKMQGTKSAYQPEDCENSIRTGITEPPRECINSAIRDQEKAVATVQEELLALFQKLQPVIIPRPSSGQDKQACHGSGSPYRCEISAITETVLALAQTVRGVTESLDL